VTVKGAARDVRVPHKKALIAADTGDIVGIVGAGYKVFTNQQAVTLCHKFCLEAFPDTTPAEWTFVEGHGPGTRSCPKPFPSRLANATFNQEWLAGSFPFTTTFNADSASTLRIKCHFYRIFCSRI
jgi:hypothetical protein